MDILLDIMQGFSGIISYIPLMFMCLIVLVCGLIGLGRGLKKGVGSIFVILTSLVFSLVITLILCSPKLPIVDGLLVKLATPLLQLMNAEMLLELGSFAVVAKYYILMFVSPWVFTFLFFAIGIIMGIFLKIFCKKIPVMSNLPKVAEKLGGLGVGFVVGFLIVIMVMMPIIGTLNVGSSAVAEISDVLMDTGDENMALMGEMMGTSRLVIDSGGTKIVRSIGVDALYNLTSNKRYEGRKVSFEGEVKGMGKFLSCVLEAGENAENMDEQNTSELFNVIAEVTEESTLVSVLASDFFSTAATSWKNGDEFMGMSSFGGEQAFVQPLMDAILDVFSTTDVNTVSADLRSLCDVFTVLNKYGIFDLSEDEEALLDKLNNSPVLSEMASVLHENPRMSKVEYEVESLGMRAFATVVGIPQVGDENYEEYHELTVSIADSINNTEGMTKEEKTDMVKNEIKNAAADYDVQVEGEVVDQITNKFIEEFGDRNDVTDQEIKDFISQYNIDSYVQ